MAGHSKWANVKHRKGAQDAKRGQIFTRLIREITIAARQNSDPAHNPRLRTAVDKALNNNMSKDTIQKAILKGAGGDESALLQEMVYEGYGPGGVAFIVECASDNKNRTVSEIRHFFTKVGGSLGTSGSVAYLFESVGVLEIESSSDFEELMLFALDHGASDLEELEESVMIECAPQDLFDLSQTLKERGYKVVNAQLHRVPQVLVPFEEELAEKITKLYEKIDNFEDVQKVFCNFVWDEKGGS